jgi:hypothetical protein
LLSFLRVQATKRGAASAPCTPNRKKEEDGGVDRLHKFQQLKMSREPQQQVERESGPKAIIQWRVPMLCNIDLKSRF